MDAGEIIHQEPRTLCEDKGGIYLPKTTRGNRSVTPEARGVLQRSVMFLCVQLNRTAELKGKK